MVLSPSGTQEPTHFVGFRLEADVSPSAPAVVAAVSASLAAAGEAPPDFSLVTYDRDLRVVLLSCPKSAEDALVAALPTVTEIAEIPLSTWVIGAWKSLDKAEEKSLHPHYNRCSDTWRSARRPLRRIGCGSCGALLHCPVSAEVDGRLFRCRLDMRQGLFCPQHGYLWTARGTEWDAICDVCGTSHGPPTRCTMERDTLRRVSTATGEVETLEAAPEELRGEVRFNTLGGLATDGGSLFLADLGGAAVYRRDLVTGAVSLLAGVPGIQGSLDGPGAGARFQNPGGLATDGAHVYVADQGDHTIRHIDLATGTVSTLAGMGGEPGYEDGIGSAARLFRPTGVAVHEGFLYVADNCNYCIRRIDLASGAVDTFAGIRSRSGETNFDRDGVGPAARFHEPRHVTTDGTWLYVVDIKTHLIRQVHLQTREVRTLAGSMRGIGHKEDTGGPVRIGEPSGIATDGTALYVADYWKATIRRIDLATGAVRILAGAKGARGSADGPGPEARFNGLGGITCDGATLYVSDFADEEG